MSLLHTSLVANAAARPYLNVVNLAICKVAVHVAIRDAITLALTLSLWVRKLIHDSHLHTVSNEKLLAP